jgi:single-strand DNA-binding protein
VPTRARRAAPAAPPPATAADAPSASSSTGSPGAGGEGGHRNEVHVVGRLAAEPEERLLPSGDAVMVFRVVVERDGPPVAGRPSLDTLECAAWTARLRRSVGAWRAGDTVSVAGAVRRRFWRSATSGGVSSRYEIEATAVRRLRRAAAAPR